VEYLCQNVDFCKVEDRISTLIIFPAALRAARRGSMPNQLIPAEPGKVKDAKGEKFFTF